MDIPNAALAYRVLDHIDADPTSWDQENWIARNECGTAACFAGWATLLSGDKPAASDEAGDAEFVLPADESIVQYIPDRAAELLGIDLQPDRYFTVGHPLFDADNTREDLGRLVEEYFGPRPAPQPQQ